MSYDEPESINVTIDENKLERLMNQILIKRMAGTAAFAVLSGLLLSSVGCSSDAGRDRSSKAVSGLQTTRDELTASRKQVDNVLASLDTLQNTQGDLGPAFNKYKEEVKKTEGQGKKVRDRAADMRARGDEYQKKWQAEMSNVSNPDLKAAAAARAEKVRTRYAKIAAEAEDARVAAEPFMKDLKDVQTYLSNDLTPAAVTAARPVFDKARQTGATLNQKIDALAADMDDVASEMSPGTAAPKQ